MSATYDYALELNGISKSFPGVKALDHVHLKLRPGSVHALCGENGAGKSTLMKIINGIHKMDEGEIRYQGQKLVPQSAKHMLEMGIATIHQELSPILDMTIAENIFLGREPKNSMGMIKVKQMYSDTQKLLNRYGFHYNPYFLMKELTVSDIALIEIIKAISRDAKVVIMDEPTSSITDSETHILFSNIKLLTAKGVGIIYISHKMDEIFDICDEVTILRDGKWIHHCSVDKIDKTGIIEKMVGRSLTQQFPKESAAIGEAAMEIRNFHGSRFQNVNLSVAKGEILGIAGLVGAGRSELFRTVFGLDKRTTGELLLNGQPVSIKKTQDAIDAGILMTSEDRKKEGVVLCLSVLENISLASLTDIMKMGFLNLTEERQRGEDKVDKLHIKIASLDTPVSALSGGNQQKIVLAKWLMKSPKVLILDEPTRGIDVGAKYEIYRLMGQLAKQGVAIIMISSEMPELIGMCDRIAVMSQGKITGELDRKEFAQEKIMTYAMRGFDNE